MKFKFRKICLLLIVLVCSSNFIYSQSKKEIVPAGLDKKISIHGKEIKFNEALAELMKQTGIKLNYNSSSIPANKTISFDYENESAFEILKKLCELTGTQLTVTPDSQVIISGKKKKLSIQGRVTDKISGEPLIGVNVIVKGMPYGAATNLEGYYDIENLERKEYTLVYNYIGYKSHFETNLDLRTTDEIERNVALETESISLSEITVTPGAFTFLKNISVAQQTLSKEEIDNMSFGEDVYRAITRIPGLSSNDFSSTFRVRGGERDEVLVTLDGMKLFEPFHIKDIGGGAISIVDAAVIGGADVYTGGFGAEYGDKMSAVFKLESITPSFDKNTLSASISMMNARLMTKGNFNEGKGDYIVSARRGYLDLILGIVGKDDLKPVYYDIYTKVGYKLSDKHKLTVNMLYAGDKFTVKDDEDTVRTSYSNNSIWMNLNSVWNNDLFSRSTFYFNHYNQERFTRSYDDESNMLQFEVNDNRKFDLFGFKQDWQYNINSDMLVKFGYDISRTISDYDYHNWYLIDIINTENEVEQSVFSRSEDMAPSGNKLGSYLSLKVGFGYDIFGEFGVRYDANSYAKDDLISPRINLSYSLTDRTFLRLGYGYFYQTQNIQDIRIENGELGFQSAELAKHYVAGFEHIFENGVSLRLEAYLKKLSNLKPSYRNFENDIEMFPEVLNDKITVYIDNSESKGLELFLKYDKGGMIGAWGSYCYSQSNDFIKRITDASGSERLVNKELPRPFDQRHTINLDLNIRPGNNWHINFAWQYRTGYPFTDKVLVPVVNGEGETSYKKVNEDYLSSKYPAYHRLDMRISKYFDTDYGVFNVFIECLNLYAHDNIRTYSWKIGGDSDNPEIIKKKRTWFPLIPSIGIRWDLDY